MLGQTMNEVMAVEEIHAEVLLEVGQRWWKGIQSNFLDLLLCPKKKWMIMSW